jgi:hypothetical protein
VIVHNTRQLYGAYFRFRASLKSTAVIQIVSVAFLHELKKARDWQVKLAQLADIFEPNCLYKLDVALVP